MAEIQWGNLQTPNLAGSLQQGYAFGNQMKQQRQAEQNRNQLRALAPQVIAGDANAYGQAVAISPETAKQYQGAGDDQLRRISGLVNYVKTAQKSGDPRAVEAAWQQARPYIAKTTGVEPPATFAEAAPHFGQLEARISMLSASKEDQVQSTRIGADGFYYTVDRSGNWTNSGIKADPRTQLRDPAGGTPGIIDLRTGTATPLSDPQMGSPQPMPQGAPPPPMAPGEVPFSIDPSLPANVQADIRARQPQYAAAAENGLEVPPQAAPTGNQFQNTQAVVGSAAAPRPAFSPAEAERLRIAQEANDRAAAAANKPSAMQERINLAREMGATPEELQAIVMGRASTAGPSAAEQKDMIARRAKIPQLQNAVRGLSRIETALQALDTPGVNTGPLDQYAVRSLPAGQELEAAVGGIQNAFLALTRVPGIGAQSDLEARIASLQYPSLDKAPEVNARTMANLKEFARDLAKAYESAVQQDASTRPAPADGPAASTGAPQRARNPQTGEVLELRDGAWVPVQ